MFAGHAERHPESDVYVFDIAGFSISVSKGLLTQIFLDRALALMENRREHEATKREGVERRR